MNELQKWAASLGATGALVLVFVGVFLWPVAAGVAMCAGTIALGVWGFKVMVLE